MVIENKFLDDIQRIWKENNNGYITYESNQMAISDSKMKQLVWQEDNIVMAYAIVYLGNDFFEKEKIPNKIKNLPNDVAYIWEIVTDKKYAGRGIANKLINYILEKYDNIPIYSCIDTTNIPSLRLHEKNGFKILYNFDKNSGNKLTHHVIMGTNV